MTESKFRQAIDLKKKIAAAEELRSLVNREVNPGPIVIKKRGEEKEINLADISFKIDNVINDTIFCLAEEELDKLYKQFKEL